MANHAVCVANKIAAKDVDAYVRPVIAEVDIDNGNIFSLVAKSTTAGEADVWKCVAPTTASLVGLWMALEPELPFATAGTNVYNGLGTVQNFYTSASKVFTAVKLVPGDIITLTAEAFVSGSTLGFAQAVNGSYLWTGSATTAGSVGGSATLRYLATTSIPLPDGTISTSHVAAYTFEVLNN